MEPLSKDDVAQIARLARLELSPEEIEHLREEMASILVHMDDLAQVSTDDVEPMTHAVPMTLRLRDDTPSPSLAADIAVGSAPDRADGQFRVPHIIKSSGNAS